MCVIEKEWGSGCMDVMITSRYCLYKDKDSDNRKSVLARKQAMRENNMQFVSRSLPHPHVVEERQQAAAATAEQTRVIITSIQFSTAHR